MKVRIPQCITMISFIVVLASAGAGCMEPVDTNHAANITPEPTETCSVPEGFCRSPSVCPGKPVNDTYAFTNKSVYHIGDVVEFGIINCGDERVRFGHSSPWWIEKWVPNATAFLPETGTEGTWEIVGDAGYVQPAVCYLNPGENWTERWDTGGRARDYSAVSYVHVVSNLTPGKYRIRYGPDSPYIPYVKEFEFV